MVMAKTEQPKRPYTLAEYPGDIGSEQTPQTKPPTPESVKKQKAVIKVLADIKGGFAKPRSLASILRENKFPEHLVRHPKRLRKIAGFDDLLNRYIPPQNVLRTHRRLLKTNTIETLPMDSSLTDSEIKGIIERHTSSKVLHISRFDGDSEARVYYTVPDGTTQRGALDMAYRLHGSYAPEKQEHTIAAVHIIKYAEGKKK